MWEHTAAKSCAPAVSLAPCIDYHATTDPAEIIQLTQPTEQSFDPGMESVLPVLSTRMSYLGNFPQGLEEAKDSKWQNIMKKKSKMIIFLSLLMRTINVVLRKADSGEIVVSKAQLFQKDWHISLSLVSLFFSVLKSLVHQWLVNEPKAESCDFTKGISVFFPNTSIGSAWCCLGSPASPSHSVLQPPQWQVFPFRVSHWCVHRCLF